MKKGLSLFSLLALSVGIAGCNFQGLMPEGNAAQPTPQTRSTKLSDVKRSAINLTNNYRTQKGKPELIFNPQLSELARQHSIRMATGKVSFGHGGFNCRAKAAREYLDIDSLAENVAMNYGYKNPATTAMNGWKKSPGHNKNMLGNYTQIGVGVARNSQGKVYITQLFGR